MTARDVGLFISHASADRDLAIALCQALEAGGQPCWLAERDIPAGTTYASHLVQALADCSGLVLIWTEAAEASVHVSAELEQAFSQRKRIFPLKLTENQPPQEFKHFLSRWQWISASGWTVDDMALAITAPRPARSGIALAAPPPFAADQDPGTALASAGQSGWLTRRTVLGLTATGLGVGLAAWGSRFWTRKPPRQFRQMVIASITPKDGFGLFRRSGIHAFVENFPNLRVVDFSDATVEQMKRGELGDLPAKLSALIDDENVLAIIGPPITEATPAIVNVVSQFESPPPLFIECSGAAALAGWDPTQKSLPVFRLNSTIEHRARLTADLISCAAADAVPVTVLVEEQLIDEPMSYGEYLFKLTSAALPDWDRLVARGSVQTRRYDHRQESHLLEQALPAIRRPGIVLVLGMGHEVGVIAKSCYARSGEVGQPNAAALLGGWMSCYSWLEQRNQLDVAKLFELTDLDIEHDTSQSEIYGQFQARFGALAPQLRDQAYSFDAAYVVHAATLRALQGIGMAADEIPTIDAAFRKRLIAEIRGTDTVGITGPIRFNAATAENASCALNALWYEADSDCWRQAQSSQDIVERSRMNG